MRTETEPQSAAWNSARSYFGDSAPIDHDNSCKQLGCKSAIRRSPRDPHPGEEPAAGHSKTAPVNEPMWDIIPTGHDSQGNEISFAIYLLSHLPEDCPYVSRDLEACVRRTGPVNTTGDFQRTALRLFEEYEEWYKKEVPIEDQLDFHINQNLESFDYLEHISGPTCQASNVSQAYSGYQLSFEEMKACTTIQCLGPKTSEYMLGPHNIWKRSSDDEDFERTSDYCLSGLGDRPGSIDDVSSCYPIRHGADELHPAMSGDDFSWGSLPFHPYCLEIYKRVSFLYHGSIGITELAGKVNRGEQWWNPMHPAVKSAQDESWFHQPGSEFLVANPVHIPALRGILQRATQKSDNDSITRHNLSNLSITSTDDPSHKSKGKDIFSTLPQETLDDIASHLPHDDIIALRHATPSFNHLQNSLWHRLVRESMPWLWEAWSDLPYSFWSCTTMRELQAHDEPLTTPSKQSHPELSDEQRKLLRKENSRARKKHRKPQPAQRLDVLRTDWHWVYYQLKREFKNIKGLQNRERIWYALAHVVQGTQESKEVLEKLHADYKKANGMR